MPKIFEEETLVVVQEIIVGSGDTDVDFVDSLALSDSLAGTLGPVNAIDSLDVADELKVSEFNAQDTVDVADQFGTISGLNASDSVDVSDALSGTLGPVNAIDSVDLSDELKVSSFNGQDSIDLSDAPDGNWSLDADAPDSIDISDRVSNIMQLDDDSLIVSDALDGLGLTAQESADFADSFASVRALLNDSVDVSDAVYPTVDGPDFVESLDVSDSFGTATEISDDSLGLDDSLSNISELVLGDSLSVSDAPAGWSFSVLHPDSLDVGETLILLRLIPPDSLDIGDAKDSWDLTDARIWPNTVVTSTGWGTPTNMTDTNEATASGCSATGTAGTLGINYNNVSTTNTLVLSWPDPTFTITSITSVVFRYRWFSSFTAGTLPSGNSVSAPVEYSVNDGTSWTTHQTITNTNNTGATVEAVDITATANTWAKIQQFRMRCIATLNSGTSTLSANVQAFAFSYARLEVTAVW